MTNRYFTMERLRQIATNNDNKGVVIEPIEILMMASELFHIYQYMDAKQEVIETTSIGAGQSRVLLEETSYEQGVEHAKSLFEKAKHEKTIIQGSFPDKAGNGIEILHIYPIDDVIQHNLGQTTFCNCNPIVEEHDNHTVIIHNRVGGVTIN